jgi:hypothetical protein
MYNKSWTIVLAFIVCCGVSCGHVATSTATASEAQVDDRAANRQDETVDIELVEFFARIGKRARRDYAQIKRLEIAGDSRLTIPERFDVIAVVKNKGHSSVQDGQFILLTTLDFVVAPNAPLNEADKIIKEYSWSRDGLVDDVKLAHVPFLESDKTARIEFKGFDLSKSNKVLSDRDMIERVWAIKVTVHVLDRNMVEIMRRDAVVTIAH